MPAGDIYELSCDSLLDLQNLTNVHHFVQVGADGTGDPRVALASIWTLSFQVAWLNTQPLTSTLVQTRGRRLLPTQTQSFFTAVGVAGGIIGDVLPANSVVVLREYAIPSGRKGIGNQRISGIPASGTDAGVIDTTYAALVELYGLPFTVDQTHVASGFVFRACVLGSDDVARKIEKVLATTKVKQLRSRTIGVGT